MNKIYLSNEKKDFLNNYYNYIFEFKNINFFIFNTLPILKNKNDEEKKQILNINDESLSLFDYKNNFLLIKATNINFSLEIFSDIFFINDYFYIINYFNNKKIDLVFKNYSSYELIEEYKKLLDEMFEERNIKNFNLNLDTIEDLNLNNITYKIVDILKTKIKTNLRESKKNIFDLYLKEYKNVPESLEYIYNYISFLRKFPLFNDLMLKYFKEKDNNYYEKLIYVNNTEEDKNLEENKNVEEDKNLEEDKTMFDPFLNFFLLNNKIINLKFLLQENITFENDFLLNTYNIPYNINYFRIKTYPNTSKEILTIYKKLLEQKKDYIKINNKIFQIFLNNNNLSLITKYFNIINVKQENEIYKEQINITINKFVFYLFFIYEYYNLRKYPNLNELEKIFFNYSINQNIQIEEPSYDDKITLDLFLYHIYTSYTIFNNDFFYSYYKKIMFNLQHFFYIFNYFKNTNEKLFPLYIYLLCSEKNLKIIKRYNKEENNILFFLEELYDKFYKNSLKIILS